jgi:very-short-patch-repair endonuclease
MRERRVTAAQFEKVDARVARVAAGQWTIVDLEELHRCGLSDGAITWRVQSGRLFPRHRGVYSVVPNPPLEGCFLAAVRACGPDAALSRYSAAVLCDWLPWDGRDPEVTAPTLRVHPGIRTYRAARVERIFIKGIPVTPPARTLIDLAAAEPYERVRRAVNEALNQRSIKVGDLVTSHHRGANKLRAVLATAAPTRNEYEDIVLAILLHGGLPMPEVNQSQLRYFPDFRWRDQRVILEADSKQFHDQMLARADDFRRQEVLEDHGDTVIRTTWNEITTRPDRVVRRVRGALSSARRPGPGARRARPGPRRTR